MDESYAAVVTAEIRFARIASNLKENWPRNSL